MPDRGPHRTCVGCRRAAPQHQLVRVVRDPDGGLSVGRTLPGRGAWLCAGSPPCLDLAERRRALGRALRGPLAVGSIGRLRVLLGASPAATGDPADW